MIPATTRCGQTAMPLHYSQRHRETDADAPRQTPIRRSRQTNGSALRMYEDFAYRIDQVWQIGVSGLRL
jgi:hypothetical protein